MRRRSVPKKCVPLCCYSPSSALTCVALSPRLPVMDMQLSDAAATGSASTRSATRQPSATSHSMPASCRRTTVRVARFSHSHAPIGADCNLSPRFSVVNGIAEGQQCAFDSARRGDDFSCAAGLICRGNVCNQPSQSHPSAPGSRESRDRGYDMLIRSLLLRQQAPSSRPWAARTPSPAGLTHHAVAERARDVRDFQRRSPNVPDGFAFPRSS